MLLAIEQAHATNWASKPLRLIQVYSAGLWQAGPAQEALNPELCMRQFDRGCTACGYLPRMHPLCHIEKNSRHPVQEHMKTMATVHVLNAALLYIATNNQVLCSGEQCIHEVNRVRSACGTDLQAKSSEQAA